MTYPTLGHRLPRRVSVPLFGDRLRHGRDIQTDDPCWQAWLATYMTFYERHQRRAIGKVVNDAGYAVMRRLDLTGKRVCEIGPGDLGHVRYWRGRPARYAALDISRTMLDRTGAVLRSLDVEHDLHLSERKTPELPFADGEFDIVVSFYSLEHLNPLASYVNEMIRILAPGGHLIGAIPAEGGLAWGLGRFLTTRRWLKRHTQVDPDKIICWEHPNLADDVLETLDAALHQCQLSFWPLRVPSIDLNLIVRLLYEKR